MSPTSGQSRGWGRHGVEVTVIVVMIWVLYDAHLFCTNDGDEASNGVCNRDGGSGGVDMTDLHQ